MREDRKLIFSRMKFTVVSSTKEYISSNLVANIHFNIELYLTDGNLS